MCQRKWLKCTDQTGRTVYINLHRVDMIRSMGSNVCGVVFGSETKIIAASSEQILQNESEHILSLDGPGRVSKGIEDVLEEALEIATSPAEDDELEVETPEEPEASEDEATEEPEAPQAPTNVFTTRKRE